MTIADLTSALLLPLPPWLGFWIFRRKGRVGLSYGYFLGGILAAMGVPWAQLTGLPVPAAQLGGALFGFTVFLQAQREGVQGVRRLAIGVGGASLFLALLLARLHLPWQEVARLWVGAAIEALLWLLLSDLAHRVTAGKHLEIRMPLVGAAALGLGALAQAGLPASLPRLPWPAALLGGLLLGLVALQQLRWLREQGAWVEGRGQGLRLALALVEKAGPAELPGLTLGLEPRQPLWLVDDQGRVLESNGPFSRLVGLPRHRLRGYALDAIFQGGDTTVWEALRSQLLQFGCASLVATQVSEDGSFRQVPLEASVFDRGMALVWIGDPAEGAVVLRGGSTLGPEGDLETRRLSANALLSLAAITEQLEATVPSEPMRRAVDRLRVATRRLGQAEPPRAEAEGRMVLESLVPGFLPLLPSGSGLEVQAETLRLAADRDQIKRIATQLLLHARERAEGRGLRLSLVPVNLGGRRFGLLEVEPVGESKARARAFFGLGWLRQAVHEAGGLLEVDQDARGSVHPRVFLPSVESSQPIPEANALRDRTIWVVDQDPLVRGTLADLVAGLGGLVMAFEDLRHMLKESRGQAPPDLLVLERTPRLERFQRALRGFSKAPVPTLVLGMGQPLPLNPAALGLRRLGFLEKPFPPGALLQALLALLRA